MKAKNLSICLQIIQLLKKCVSINNIELRYSTSDVEDEQTSIREVVKKLIQKVGLISSIKITRI